MVAYARGSPCRQPSCPGGPIAAGARCLSLLKVVNTGAPKIPHHESWSPGDACTKPRRAFNSLLEKEPKSGKSPGQARPAGPSGHQLAATQIAPARPRCPTLLWDITITAPRAALAHENGLTAAANPWGCPLPGGGVRLPSSPAGGSPGRGRSRSSWWTRRATRATSGADFVSTHRNARTPSFAVGAGQSQSGRSSPPPPRRRRSVACPRRLAKS